MCGCEQGLCLGGCACGCSHTWPPTQEEVQRIVDREAQARRGWVDRAHELVEERDALKDLLNRCHPRIRHDHAYPMEIYDEAHPHHCPGDDLLAEMEALGIRGEP